MRDLIDNFDILNERASSFFLTISSACFYRFGRRRSYWVFAAQDFFSSLKSITMTQMLSRLPLAYASSMRCLAAACGSSCFMTISAASSLDTVSQTPSLATTRNRSFALRVNSLTSGSATTKGFSMRSPIARETAKMPSTRQNTPEHYRASQVVNALSLVWTVRLVVGCERRDFA